MGYGYGQEWRITRSEDMVLLRLLGSDEMELTLGG